MSWSSLPAASSLSRNERPFNRAGIRSAQMGHKVYLWGGEVSKFSILWWFASGDICVGDSPKILHLTSVAHGSGRCGEILAGIRSWFVPEISCACTTLERRSGKFWCDLNLIPFRWLLVFFISILQMLDRRSADTITCERWTSLHSMCLEEKTLQELLWTMHGYSTQVGQDYWIPYFFLFNFRIRGSLSLLHFQKPCVGHSLTFWATGSLTLFNRRLLATETQASFSAGFEARIQSRGWFSTVCTNP